MTNLFTTFKLARKKSIKDESNKSFIFKPTRQLIFQRKTLENQSLKTIKLYTLLNNQKIYISSLKKFFFGRNLPILFLKYMITEVSVAKR